MSEPTIGPAIPPQLRELLPEDGPTYDEVKRSQRPENQAVGLATEVADHLFEIGLSHTGADIGVDVAAHLTKRAFASASLGGKVSLVGHAVANLMFGYEVTAAVYDLTVKKAMEEGKQQAEGRLRDQKNLALLMIVQVAGPDALPDGYFRSEVSRVLGTDGKAALNANEAFKKASVVLGKAQSDPELARSRDILVASMREGVATAYQRGLDSKGSLDHLSSTDAAFRTRYETDPAFRNGINSVVWQATMHRDEYDTAIALNAGYRGSMTRM